MKQSPHGLQEGKSHEGSILLRWGLAQDLSGDRRREHPWGIPLPVCLPALLQIISQGQSASFQK